jgi:hypothetical protein
MRANLQNWDALLFNCKIDCLLDFSTYPARSPVSSFLSWTRKVYRAAQPNQAGSSQMKYVILTIKVRQLSLSP